MALFSVDVVARIRSPLRWLDETGLTGLFNVFLGIKLTRTTVLLDLVLGEP